MRASLAFVILLLPSAMAQEQPPDFSEGLNRLAALGLPEMKEAEWVRLKKGDPMGQYAESYELREIGVKLDGGAWRLKGDPARMLAFGSRQVSATEATGEGSAEPEPKEKTPGLLEKMMRNYDAQKKPAEGEKKPVPKEKPDLATNDADLLVDALGKPKAREELGENMGYGRYDLPGQLLVFAAQLQAAGKTAAANRLAGALFSLADDKNAVVDAAVSNFATNEYDAATAAFFEDYDWAKYHQTLKDLLAKYPRGWNQAGAIAILMGPLEKRAKGEKPPVPSLPGIELKPEALALLDSLLERQTNDGISDEALAKSHGVDLSEIPARHREQYLQMLRQQGMAGSGRPSMWLLIHAGGNDATGKLTAMGMDGLIALAAVVTDDTLLPLNMRGGSRSYSYSYSSNRSAEEIAMEAYRRMSRPTTRGEFAAMLLGQVIPSGEDNDFDEEDPESLQAAAIDFWKQHRDKNNIELAAFYLSGGSGAQRSSACSMLAAIDDPQAHAVFEKAVLSSGDPMSFLSEVETYLDVRKADGKPFLDAYAKLLRESVANKSDDDYDSGYYQLKQSGGVEKYLTKLSLSVGGVSLKELVEEALKATPEEGSDGSPFDDLGEVAQKASTPELLTVIGEAAAKAKPEQKMELYGLLFRATHDREDRWASTDKEKNLATLLELWKPLLAETGPFPETGTYADWSNGFGGKNLGDGAALFFEIAVDADAAARYQNFNRNGIPGDLMPFVRGRVNALVEGKEPLPWPDADQVPTDRREEITAKLGSLPAKEIISFARSLPVPERLLVAEIMTSYGEDTPPPATLIELRDTVAELRSYSSRNPHDAALLEKLGVTPGWRVSPENLQKLAEILANDAKASSGSCVSFFPGPMHVGLLSTAANQLKWDTSRREFEWETLAMWSENEGAPDAVVMLAINRAIELWTVKDGKVSKADFGGQVSPALPYLKEIQASKNASLPYIQLAVLTREDTKQFLNEEKAEEE